MNMNGLSDSAGAPAQSVASDRGGLGGRITHDVRGNAVWQWGVATGVFAKIKMPELLSMLDNPTLALEGERAVESEWAGDPYNRR